MYLKIVLNNFTDCKMSWIKTETDESSGFTAATGSLVLNNMVLNLY
jgi:hypothetical protein